MSEERLVTPKEFCERLSISKTTFFNWVNSGKLPQPIRLGDRILRWKSSVVDEAIDSLCNGNNAENS